MPQQHQTEYWHRINKVLTYIQKNINHPINLSEAAEQSHFSPYHFHRIFHSLVGETLNDFIARKRMENAARTLLCQRKLSITAISEQGGFSSSANFSKAFKLYFGISPSQLRNPNKLGEKSKIGKLYRKYGKEFDPQSLYSQFVTQRVTFDPKQLEEFFMNVNIQEMAEKNIAFLTAPKGYELEAIFATWDKITQWAKHNGVDQPENKRFSICHDNPMMTPIDKCRYDASIEVERELEIKPPFKQSTIPAGKYAVAHYKGDGDKVSQFYMELYSHWLPNSGFEPDNFPPIAHYLNDSRTAGFVEMEVYLKLKTLSNRDQ